MVSDNWHFVAGGHVAWDRVFDRLQQDRARLQPVCVSITDISVKTVLYGGAVSPLMAAQAERDAAK